MNLFKIKHCLLFFSIISVSVLCSCAVFPGRANNEATLKKRVEGFMVARMAKDWRTVYGYFSSSYREKTTESDFIRNNGSQSSSIKKFTIESIEINPSGRKAMVKIKADLKIDAFDFKGMPINQTWVKERFNWYLKFNDAVKPAMP